MIGASPTDEFSATCTSCRYPPGSSRYRVAVKRTLCIAVTLLCLGLVAAIGGPGGVAGAAPTTTTSTPNRSTPLGWLTIEARPANARLNRDQAEILADTHASTKSTAKADLARLASACRSMLRDAKRAEHLPNAPTAQLRALWHTMATATATYASDCLALTRSQTKASLATWDTSLHSMNQASGALNTLVQQIRTAG